MGIAPILICMGFVVDYLSAHLLHTGAPSVTDPMQRPSVVAPTTQRVAADHLPLGRHLRPEVRVTGHLSLPDPPSGSNYCPRTPINPERLFTIIRGSPHARHIYLGFKFGFRIPHVPSPWSHPVRNHSSAYANQAFLDQYIAKELEAGRIVGPFSELPSHCIVSPLGLVPKQEPGSFRVIHDLSFPKGKGVNDLIPNNLTSVSYEDFDHVVGLIRRAGQGALISKVDIQNAFRIMPIHPSDVHLVGFAWRGLFYLDKCLPMGCSISCALFERFSSALQYALLSKFSFSSLSHILDDFIFISPSDSPLCNQQLSTFLKISDYAGIPIKTSKTVAPSTCVPIHGILVDTVAMEARLPPDKLSKLLDLVSSFALKRSARLKLCQSLLGHLSFACRVIGPGRPFLRRMFDLLRGHTNPNHFLRIPRFVRSDCNAWRSFLLEFNGISLLTPLAPLDSGRMQLYSDASDWGCAAIFGARWFQLTWPPSWRSKHINVREFLPILLALDTWGSFFKHSALTFRCDNQSVVNVLNAGTTRDPDMLLILRAITLLTLRLDVSICALHFPGKLNVTADWLSRSQATPKFLMEAGLFEAPTPLKSSTRKSMGLLEGCFVQH